MTPNLATLQDFAKADVLVTTKEYLHGEPTVPLSHALNTADEKAEHEPEDQDLA
jgi:hypothetical protein